MGYFTLVCLSHLSICPSLHPSQATRRPRGIEILGWGPAGPILPHGEKVPL